MQTLHATCKLPVWQACSMHSRACANETKVETTSQRHLHSLAPIHPARGRCKRGPDLPGEPGCGSGCDNLWSSRASSSCFMRLSCVSCMLKPHHCPGGPDENTRTELGAKTRTFGRARSAAAISRTERQSKALFPRRQDGCSEVEGPWYVPLASPQSCCHPCYPHGLSVNLASKTT